jgi:hypothetical protein
VQQPTLNESAPERPGLPAGPLDQLRQFTANVRECGRKLLGEQRLLEASMTEPELDGAARKAALWRFRAVVANRQHLLSLTERVRLADTKPHRDLQRAYYELRRLVAEAITVQSNWYRHVSVAQPIPLLGRRKSWHLSRP